MHIVLHQPQIPPNTGNTMRLCANIGAALHLIHPLGFAMDDRRLRRAGLDYRDQAVVKEWQSYTQWRAALPAPRVIAASKHGRLCYDRVQYSADDALLFGCETAGLPADLLAIADLTVHIPMRAGNRSLNLSNSVAVIAYEAWRQLGFRRDPRDRTASSSRRR